MRRSTSTRTGLQTRKAPGHAKALAAALTLTASLVLGVALATATAPTVSVENASSVSFNSAEVKGTVDPQGLETTYRFQYATEPDFSDATTGLEGVIEGSSQTVEGTLGGLSPGTTYHLRLLASNVDGDDEAIAATTFTTDAVNPPSATIDPVTTFTGTTAHFSGTVNSGGSGPGEATEYGFRCEPAECPGIEGFQPLVPSDGTDQLVEADPTGLLPNTPYTVTLAARSAGGEDSDSAVFTTAAIGPEATTYSVHGYPTDTTAHVAGLVDPNNSPTDYWFEYGPADCASNPCQSLPASQDADAGSGDGARALGQDIGGLSPSTTYHYRIVADNGVGAPVAGSDETFTTTATPPPAKPCPNAAIRQQQGSAQLGGCRAWELVSPPDKNNGAILGGHIAAGGGRALINVAGGVEGGGVNSPTLSVRTATGWDSHSILPPPEQRPYPSYYFSVHDDDLTRFVAVSTSSVFAGEGPAAVFALDGEGGQTQLSSVPGRQGTRYPSQVASSDFSQIYGSIRTPFFDPEHVPNSFNIYDLAQDPPVLVSRLPDGSVPICGVDQGRGFLPEFSTAKRNWVSGDGSRIFFLSRGSANESCIDPNELYVRNRTTNQTTLISGPALGAEAGDAEFLQANPAGTEAMFFTTSSLTAEDTDTSGDVYRWSEAGEVLDCVTCVAAAPADISNGEIRVAVAPDLSRVYFTSRSALAPGALEGEFNLYVWHVTAGSGTQGRIDHVAFAPKIANLIMLDGQLSPDGRFAFFASGDPGNNVLAGADNGGTAQLYRYDDVLRTLACVSCPAAGPAQSSASVSVNAQITAGTYVRTMSDDGSRIVFQSGDALVSADVNDGPDLYEWHDGAVSLISDGSSTPGAENVDRLLGISADGTDVLFQSAAVLTSGVIDSANQVYVARVGGGFAAPPSPPTPCAGDGCRPASPSAPGPIAPATSAFAGPPNPKAKRHHKKKQRQHKKKRGAKKRGANHNRGGAK